MLSKILPFEQDREAIYLRNQEMYHHYSRLESIKQRKNEYLPEIPTQKIFTGLKKNISSPQIINKKHFLLQKDNKLIFQKLDRISHRTNQINSDNEAKVIDEYLNIKKNTLEKYREFQKGLIEKENIKLKKRITRTKPVIDNKIIDNDFQKFKKIADHLRKVKPKENPGNVYLNRKESQIIRRYEKERAEYYLKTRAKENKENNIISFKRNIKTNQYNNFHSNIDKNILKKIPYL